MKVLFRIIQQLKAAAKICGILLRFLCGCILIYIHFYFLYKYLYFFVYLTLYQESFFISLNVILNIFLIAM